MEFTAAGARYRVRRPCARDQFLLLRRILPLTPALRAIGLREAGTLGVLSVVDSIPEAELVSGIEGAFALCEREVEGGWVPADLAAVASLPASLEIVAVVVAHNFGAYFAVKRSEYQTTWSSGPGFEPVLMPDDLDWLYRPVLRGMCRTESLIDGTLHLEHLAEMNAVLDAADENQRRAHKAAEAAANRT